MPCSSVEAALDPLHRSALTFLCCLCATRHRASTHFALSVSSACAVLACISGWRGGGALQGAWCPWPSGPRADYPETALGTALAPWEWVLRWL